MLNCAPKVCATLWSWRCDALGFLSDGSFDLKPPHALVAVFSFLGEVEVHVVAERHLVLSRSQTKSRSESFVRIAQLDAVEATANKGRHASRGVVGHTAIESFFVVLIDEPTRENGVDFRPVVGDERGRHYLIQRIFESYIVSCGEKISGFHFVLVCIAHRNQRGGEVCGRQASVECAPLVEHACRSIEA